MISIIHNTCHMLFSDLFKIFCTINKLYHRNKVITLYLNFLFLNLIKFRLLLTIINLLISICDSI